MSTFGLAVDTAWQKTNAHSYIFKVFFDQTPVE